MKLLRVSAVLTFAMLLAACSGQSTRPEPVQPPSASPKPDITQAQPPVAAPQATVPQAATAPAPAPIAVPPSDFDSKTRVAKAAEPKAIDAARAKLPTAPRAQAATAGVAAPKSSSAATTSLRGQVILDAAADQNVGAGETTDAVLYFLPRGGSRHPKPGNYHIYTHNKQFDPPLLVIPVGSTVKFPNQDEILHNVYSTTPGSTFDLGIYGNGGSGEYTFRKPGLVLIHCNVHEGMQADVLVLDTPYIARPAADGTFDLVGLPTGPGKLMVWHPRAARPVALAISVPTAQHPVVHIAITRPRAPPHHDKNGQAYRAARP